MNWFDVGFLIALAVFMIIGAIKGFVDQLFSLAGVLVTVLLSVSFCGVMAELFPTDSGAIYEKTVEITDEKLGDSEYYDMVADWSDESNKATVKEVIKQIGVPGIIVELGVFNWLIEEFPQGEAALKDVLPQTLTQVVNKAVAFAVLFIVISIAVLILKLTMKKIAKQPGISTINRFLGLILGGIKITSIVVCATAALTFVGSFIGFIGNFVESVVFTDSVIGEKIIKPLVEWVLTLISTV